MRDLKDSWTSWFVVLSMLAVSAALAQLLPETVATHFNIHGEPDGYGSRAFALSVIPVITIALLLATPTLVRRSPRGYQMQNSGAALTRMLFATSLLLASVHAGMLMRTARPDFAEMNSYLAFGLAVFLMIFGDVLGKTERNYFVGIRTPWTLASDETWRATHRFGGKLFVASGIIGLISLPSGYGLAVVLSLVLANAAFAVMYSYLHFRRLSSAA